MRKDQRCGGPREILSEDEVAGPNPSEHHTDYPPRYLGVGGWGWGSRPPRDRRRHLQRVPTNHVNDRARREV